MKQKFTLVGLMLLLATFTFGQMSIGKQKLDSIVCYESHKYLWNYNSVDNSTKLSYYEWEEAGGQWEYYPFNAQCFFYDDGNLTVTIWGEEKSENNYNENGDILNIVYYYLDENENWIVYDSTAYSYNVNEKLELYITFRQESNLWKRMSKRAYTYNENNDILQIHSYSWEDDQWGEPYLMSDYKYNENGDIIELKVYDYRLEFTLDDNGNPTETIAYYNDIKDSKIVWNYHPDFLFSELVRPVVDWGEPGEWLIQFMVNIPKQEIVYIWDETNSEWMNGDTTNFYYSGFTTTSINNLKKDNKVLYPNPVSDNVNFNITSSNNTFTFELYTSQGRKLISKEITNNEQLSLEGLAKGIYLYNLNIDGEIQSGKLIKE